MSGAGFKLDRSAQLERLWPMGFSLIGDVTFESAAYVARYVLKKVCGPRDAEDRLVDKGTGEILSPEYVTMSRGSGLNDPDPRFRGGIGRAWYDKYVSDVYPRGIRVVRGRDMRAPRFYDNLYAVADPLGFEGMKFERAKCVDKKDNISDRLVVKEKVTIARLKLLPRGYEEE